MNSHSHFPLVIVHVVGNTGQLKLALSRAVDESRVAAAIERVNARAAATANAIPNQATVEIDDTVSNNLADAYGHKAERPTRRTTIACHNATVPTTPPRR